MSFFNYLQPSIVQIGKNDLIPDNLSYHYLINMNVIGIKYFETNFLLIHGENGDYEYMLTNDGEKLFVGNDEDNMKIDIPRIYLLPSEKIIEDNSDAFREFFIASLADNAIFYTGTDNFKPGVDYWMNKTLFDYIVEYESEVLGDKDPDLSYCLPNYLDGDYVITQYWEQLPDELKNYTDFKYFYNKNIALENNSYDSSQLDNLYSTFFNIILKQCIVDEEKINEKQNIIYKQVMEYFANFMVDSASIGINLILNNYQQISESQYNYNVSCGCNSSNSQKYLNSQNSCFNMYVEAMKQYLKDMLGSLTFYKDWFYIQNGEEYIVNYGAIDNLLELLKEFEEADYDLSFSQSRKLTGFNCENSVADYENSCNHAIIKNYMKVLEYIRSGAAETNVNKIKVYGQNFAELLPKLQF